MELSLSGTGAFGLIAFIVASGFTWAGLLSSFHKAVSDSGPEFRLSFANPLLAGWSLFVCIFAGPFIVVQNTTKYWRKGFLPNAILLFGFALALMWSFFSGVFIVQLASAAGLILV